MPITVIDIERKTSWRISFFFLLLIVFYFVITLSLTSVLYEVFSLGIISGAAALKRGNILIILLFSALVASVHFYLSAVNALSSVERTLGAVPPDPNDGVHQRLINIVEEIQAASGHRARIRAVVIPTLSMNALSAVDLKGNAIIAITEGLLSRISRAQLETVLAHEACHILSGDCLESTVASSLFGIPATAIEKMAAAFEGKLFLSPAFIFAWLMVRASYLLNLFVSREREYRADAGAVRMTRNPIALAEVLYVLSRNWRGRGYIGTGLEMLCFMNTAPRSRDESEGWLADLMSTHPPVRKRIRVLLEMARISISELRRSTRAPQETDHRDSGGDLYYALDSRHQWQGPYNLIELAAVPWLSTLTWISSSDGTMEKASQLPVVNRIFEERLSRDRHSLSPYRCPSCGHPLTEQHYDSTTIMQCRFCGGALIEDGKIARILARKNGQYPERIQALARTTLTQNQMKRLTRNRKRKGPAAIPLIPCPKCSDPMMRTFYSSVYLVELDRCTLCALTWFDYDELEMLRCMIDHKMASDPLPRQFDDKQTSPSGLALH